MIISTRVCDLDEADYRREAQPVQVGLDGDQLEIDLCYQHRGDLESMAAPYLIAARRTGRAQGPAKSRPRTSRQRAADVRAWAARNGWPQLEHAKGRLPREVELAAAQAGIYVGEL